MTESASDALPKICNIPYSRNPNFTGRKILLSDIKKALTAGKTAILTQDDVGFGGTGKKQIAAEYAYSHATDYSAVWWIRAQDTPELAESYVKLAVALKLPEKDARNILEVVEAVKYWLEKNPGWLLILENAPDLEGIISYLPRRHSDSHTILISRNSNWHEMSDSIPVNVGMMEREESIEFLLKRTNQTDKAAAASLAKALEDFPLAMEQAGAYIEASKSSLRDYLNMFYLWQQELLSRSMLPEMCPHTVATTYYISFQHIIESSSQAEDIMNLCSFLAPENIPLKLLNQAGKCIPGIPVSESSTSSNFLAIDDAIAELERYSLVKLERENTLTIHSLVQTLGYYRLEESARHAWAKRAVSFMENVFECGSITKDNFQNRRLISKLLNEEIIEEDRNDPHRVYFSNNVKNKVQLIKRFKDININKNKNKNFESSGRINTDEIERILAVEQRFHHNMLEYLCLVSHALATVKHAEKLVSKPGTTSTIISKLLNMTGSYLRNLGLLNKARSIFEKALLIDESVYGINHINVAIDADNLGSLLLQQGRELKNAQKCYKRAVKIFRKFRGRQYYRTEKAQDDLKWLSAFMRREKRRFIFSKYKYKLLPKIKIFILRRRTA